MTCSEGEQKMMNRFENKTVVITGGTSGIGAECARQFCVQGATVIITGRNSDRGERIAQELSKSGSVRFIRLDVTNTDEIKKFSELISNEYKGADILFNNAGVYPAFGKFEESNTCEWNDVFNINLFGMVDVCRSFINQLERNNGVIINNASIAGLQGFTSGSGYAYAASKSAVIKFTKMLAKNYAKSIRINCICPGVIDTPIYLNLNKEKMIERTPVGRVGTPKDVAPVVLFLASEDAAFVCGAVLTIDGGMTL